MGMVGSVRAWPVAHALILPAVGLHPGMHAAHSVPRPCPGPRGWGSYQPPCTEMARTLPLRGQAVVEGVLRGTLHALNSGSAGPHGKDTGRTQGVCGWRSPRLAVHSGEWSSVQCPPSLQATWPAGNCPPTLRPPLPQMGSSGSPVPPAHALGLASEARVLGPVVVCPRSPSPQPGEPQGPWGGCLHVSGQGPATAFAGLGHSQNRGALFLSREDPCPSYPGLFAI